jgi:hypothetical protein
VDKQEEVKPYGCHKLSAASARHPQTTILMQPGKLGRCQNESLLLDVWDDDEGDGLDLRRKKVTTMMTTAMKDEITIPASFNNRL